MGGSGYAVKLSEAELLFLDGKCRPEVQAFVDEVKGINSLGGPPTQLGLLFNEELAEWPHNERVRDVLLERAQGGDDEARSILDNPRREEPAREALEVRAQAWREVGRAHEKELRALDARVLRLERELAEWIGEAS